MSIEVESATIRIGRRDVLLTKSNRVWRLTSAPLMSERTSSICLMILPLICIVPLENAAFRGSGLGRVSFEVITLLVCWLYLAPFAWPGLSVESLTMRCDNFTVSRSFGVLVRRQVCGWARLQGPILERYRGRGALPVQMLFQDPWQGKRARFGPGARIEDVEKVKHLMQVFRAEVGC